MARADQVKVLAVDDTATSRMLLRDALDTLGFRNVVCVADGEEALKAVLASVPHVIISDYNMPKIDGLQLLHAFRSHKPTARTPFIMLTGTGNVGFITRGKTMGLNNYLQKPVEAGALRKALEMVLGNFN